MKLMIVDDSSFMRKRIKMLLTDLSLEIVGEAANGKEALAIFQKTQPDLVTMDITMPELDGLATTRAIMQLKPDTRILIVSGLASRAVAIEAIENGARDFLKKPFDNEQVKDALIRLIGTGETAYAGA